MRVYVLFSKEKNGKVEILSVFVTMSEAVDAKESLLETSPYYSKSSVSLQIEESAIGMLQEAA